MTRIKRGYIARRRRTKIRLFASSSVSMESHHPYITNWCGIFIS